jgi:hypothetical protein
LKNSCNLGFYCLLHVVFFVVFLAIKNSPHRCLFALKHTQAQFMALVKEILGLSVSATAAKVYMSAAENVGQSIDAIVSNFIESLQEPEELPESETKVMANVGASVGSGRALAAFNMPHAEAEKLVEQALAGTISTPIDKRALKKLSTPETWLCDDSLYVLCLLCCLLLLLGC